MSFVNKSVLKITIDQKLIYRVTISVMRKICNIYFNLFKLL